MYDDVPDRSMKVKTLLMTVAIVGVLLLAVGILFAVIWGASRDWTRPAVDTYAGGGSTSAVTWHGMHGGEPVTPEEKRVAEYIQGPRLGYAAPQHLLWETWGPNDVTEETHFRVKGNKVKIVRVRYVCEWEGRPKEQHDDLFAFGLALNDPDAIVRMRANPDGDRWFELAKADKKAEEDEAMRGPHR
jgi:hypothetical protein